MERNEKFRSKYWSVYIYIYIYDCFVSQFAIIAIWYNIIKVMIIIGT